MRPISIGIIGVGFGKRVHLPAFRSDSRCQVKGICAAHDDRALEVAKEFRIPRTFYRWEELVRDPEIDAVSIAVPPTLQAPIVCAAARAGKHVFCEKPLSSSLSCAREMLRCA